MINSKSIPIYMLGLSVFLTPFFLRYSKLENIITITNSSDSLIDSMQLINEDGKSIKVIDSLVENTSCKLNLSVYHTSDEIKLIHQYNDNQNIQSLSLKKSRKELPSINEIIIIDVDDNGALSVTIE